MTRRLLVFFATASGLLLQAVQADESDTLWTRTFGGPNADGAYAIESTSDGGFIVAGEKEISYFGPTDVYLLKVDGNGDLAWSRTFGETNANEIGRSVQQTSDGGYIVAGYAGVGQDNQVYLLKTDSEGNFQWDASFGPTPDNRGHCVRQTSDGGYIIAGQAYVVHGAFGSYDSYIIKTDAQGGLEWQRFMGGDMNDYALTVCEVLGGGYIAAGRTQSFGVWDAYLIKLSAVGDSLWARAVGGAAADEATDIMELPDGGGFVFSGISVAPSRGDGDVYLARTDTDGNIVWSRTYGGDSDDDGQSLAMTRDGGYIIAAMSSSFGAFSWDVYVIRTDSLGNEIWSRTFGNDGDDRGHGVTRQSDGSFAVAGWTSSFGAGWLDVYVIKFQGDGTVSVDDGADMPREIALGPNYPNPFNATTSIPLTLSEKSTIEISIYDIPGQRVSVVTRGVYPPGEHRFVWDGKYIGGGNAPSGIYFYRADCGGAHRIGKMVLLR